MCGAELGVRENLIPQNSLTTPINFIQPPEKCLLLNFEMLILKQDYSPSTL